MFVIVIIVLKRNTLSFLGKLKVNFRKFYDNQDYISKPLFV